MLQFKIMPAPGQGQGVTLDLNGLPQKQPRECTQISIPVQKSLDGYLRISLASCNKRAEPHLHFSELKLERQSVMIGYRHPDRGGGGGGGAAMLRVAAVIAVTVCSSFLHCLPVASGAAVSSLRTTRTSRTLQATTAEQDDHRSWGASVAAAHQLDDSDPWCVNCRLHRCSRDERAVGVAFIFC